MSRWLAVLFVVIILSLIVLPTGAEIPALPNFGISPKSGGFIFPTLHHPFLRDYGTFSFRDSALPMERGSVPTGYVTGEKASLPFSFIPNTGQLNDPTILFVVKNRDSTLYFTREEVILAASRGREEHGTPDVIRQSFEGADYNRVLMGAMELPQKTNFLVGQDPSRWRSNITTYGAVTYYGLYPGINLTYFGSEGHLKREFMVAPRANSSSISFRYEGILKMAVGADGTLHLMTQGGEMRESPPVSYQTIGGQRKDVLSWYEVTGPGTVRIATGEYDHNLPLIIDPKLDYSTYYGGSSDDGGLDGSNIFHQNNAIITDSSGNAYVTGFTQSHDFRTTTGVVNASPPGTTTPNDRDIFILKLNAAGSAPVWATYYGGSSDEWGKGLAVDGSGNVYVTGYTISTDFLTTSGVVNATSISSGNNNDAFIIKLNPSGSAPVYATYFGSSDGDDSGLGLWVDGDGNAYITGETQSTDFYTTAGVLNTTSPSGGGGTDVFIVKLNPGASAPVYSTYYGGSAHDDEGHSIAVDTGGNAFVAGHTHANNFPTTTGAANATKIGVLEDAFVLKINPTATAVLYSTYYGGTQDDIANGIAIDTAGNAYVTGQTRSTDFRVTAGSVNTSKIGGTTGSPDAFVFKLNNDGSAPVWATYYGGTNEDYGQSITRGSSGDLFITGITRSLNFLVTSDAYQKTHGGGTYDAFLVRLKSDGSAPVYSTYFGGGQDDVGLSIALDSAENAYVTGSTLSTNFPTSSGAANSTRVGGRDAFIFKFFMNPPVSDFTANTTSGYTPQGIQFNDTSTSIGIQYWNWSFGDNTWFNTTDSSLRNATHTYTNVSSYTINLTITNATTSDTLARLNYVNVSAPLPIPAFTSNTTSGHVPQAVQFNDTTLTTSVISWNWSFGDNPWFNTTDSTLRNATHTYASAGTFTVNLSITNSSGLAVPSSNTNITSRAGYLSVVPLPVPDFTGSPTGGGSVTCCPVQRYHPLPGSYIMELVVW